MYDQSHLDKKGKKAYQKSFKFNTRKNHLHTILAITQRHWHLKSKLLKFKYKKYNTNKLYHKELNTYESPYITEVHTFLARYCDEYLKSLEKPIDI